MSTAHTFGQRRLAIVCAAVGELSDPMQKIMPVEIVKRESWNETGITHCNASVDYAGSFERLRQPLPGLACIIASTATARYSGVRSSR